MQTSVKIAFRHCEPSEEIRAEIAAQMEGLEQLSPRITSCRIVVSGPKTRHKRGTLFHVQLRAAMPEGKDVIVDQRQGDAGEREHPLLR
jgi:ribosome-associated translation inhibitor RaiA